MTNELIHSDGRLNLELLESGKVTQKDLVNLIMKTWEERYNKPPPFEAKQLLLGIIELGTQFGGFMNSFSSDQAWLICHAMRNTNPLVAKFFILGAQLKRNKYPEMDKHYG